MAPLLGDTPRRVKRFVNTCQLMLAMPPPLRAGGPFPSEREVVCLLAAVNEGLPALAEHLFKAIDPGAYGTLQDVVGTGTPVAEAERARLERWLDTNTDWRTVPLSTLCVRLDMVRRLRFEMPTAPL